MTRHPAERAAAAREVGRSVRERDGFPVARAAVEAELLVAPVALRREVHLGDHRLEDGRQAPSRVHHGAHHRRAVARYDPRTVAVDIEIATTVTEEMVAAFELLIPQLSSSSPPPGQEALAAIVADPDSVLFLARIDGRIIGSLTLALYRIPTRLKAWIEDVVVDESARGRGVGEALSQAALDEARRRGAKDVSLTSRPSREAANRLYQRLGFHRRETIFYRYDLP